MTNPKVQGPAISRQAVFYGSVTVALVVAFGAITVLAPLARSEGQAPSWCTLAASQLGEDSKETCRSFGFSYDDAAATADQQHFSNPAAPSWCNLPPSQLGDDSKETCSGFGYRFNGEVAPETQEQTVTAIIAAPTSAPPVVASPTSAPLPTTPATTAPPTPEPAKIVVKTPTSVLPASTTTTPAARLAEPVQPVEEPVQIPVVATIPPTTQPPTTAPPTTAPPTTVPPTTAPPTTVPPTTAPPTTAPPARVQAGTQVVVIDPGHGAIRQENGDFAFQRPVSANGLVEDQVVLDISRRVEQLLDASGGYDTRLTREDYRAPFAPTGCGVPCITDLRERREWAEAQDADLLLSIHLNAFSSPDANGTETYRFTGSSSAAVDQRERQLAERINDNLSALGLKDRGVKTNRGWSVIRSTRFPSVLIEVAFITGSQDGEKLRDPAFRDRVAEAIVAAVVATS